MMYVARKYVQFALIAPIAFSATTLVGCGGGTQKPVVGAQVETHVRTPSNPAAVSHMAQGVQAMKDKVPARAIEFFRDAIKEDPKMWEARFDLGVTLAQTGDLAGAEDELGKTQKLAPNDEDVAIALAEVRRRRGETKDAADGMDDFLKANPNSINARVVDVTALRESNQYDAAIMQAREVLEKKPGDATALAELALSYLAKGNHDTAEVIAKQALDANPKSAVAHRAMGLVALYQGDDAAAFQSFQKAAQEDPHDTTSRLNMASVLMHAGAYPKAEEQYRAVLQVAPDDADANIGLAAAIRASSDAKTPAKLEEAKNIYEKVLASDPHAIAAEYNLGVLYIEFLKRPADAQKMFSRFLDDAPKSHPARAQAEKYLQTASAAAPPPPPAAPPGAAPQAPSAKPGGSK